MRLKRIDRMDAERGNPTTKEDEGLSNITHELCLSPSTQPRTAQENSTAYSVEQMMDPPASFRDFRRCISAVNCGQGGP